MSQSGGKKGGGKGPPKDKNKDNEDAAGKGGII